MARSSKWEHNSHLNHLRPRFTEDATTQEELQMDVLYDIFDIPTPTLEMIVPRRTSKIKRTQVEPSSPFLIERKIDFRGK